MVLKAGEVGEGAGSGGVAGGGGGRRGAKLLGVEKILTYMRLILQVLRNEALPNYQNV